MRLIIKGLNLVLDGKKILDNINVIFEDKYMNAIIGPNGSGKTSLLRVISGIYRASSGTVECDASIGLRKNVFYLPSEMEPFPGLKVIDYLQISLDLRGIYGTRDLDDLQQVLDDFDVGDLLFQDLSTLSSGEKQRVFLSAAAATKRKIILLDEPTSHLDIKWTYRAMSLLKKYMKHKLVIFTTHDINLASIYARYIALIHEGKIVAEGPPSSVLNESLLSNVYRVKLVSGQVGGYRIFVPEHV